MTDQSNLIAAEPLLVLDARAAHEVLVADARREQMLSTVAASGQKQPARYAVADGIATININGSLLNYGDFDLSRYGATSYGWLANSFNDAAADPAVKGVALRVNSPGGVVSGIESASGALASLRATNKPVVAYVEGMAASAGYWLASQADEIVMTALSQVGSIGVYTAHVDISKALAKYGFDVTLIASGRHKVEGNPYEALPSDVKDRMQAQIDDLRVAFAQAVSAGRGTRLSAEAAMATEARMYRGRVSISGVPEAVDAGLADKIGTFADAVTVIRSRAFGGRIRSNRGVAMSEQNGGPAAENAGFTQAQLDAARAEGHAAGLAAGRIEGHATGFDEANARIAAIASAEGVKGNGARLSAAIDLALKSKSMAAADVASFVEANVGAAPAPRANPANVLGDAPAQAPRASSLAAAVDREIEQLKPSR